MAGLGVLGAVVVFVVPQPVAGAAVGSGGAENPAARAAVMELTGAHPGAVAIPADFADDSGYQPVLTDGLQVDPGGACSSPVPLPAEFRTACQAHDLGYDMLRYADDHGQPLGPWARQAVDATLEQRLRDVCDHHHGLGQARCQATANVAANAVDLNSRRQNYATPRPEYIFGIIQLSGEHLGYQLLAVAATAALVLGGIALARHRVRTRQAAANGAEHRNDASSRAGWVPLDSPAPASRSGRIPCRTCRDDWPRLDLARVALA